MKQISVVLPILLLHVATIAGAGAGQSGVAADHDGSAERGPKIIIRQPNERKPRAPDNDSNRATQNSNRQSDEDSKRGLERAEERRAEPGSNEPGTTTSGKDDGWYEYLFGKRAAEEQQSERDWYGYLFGRHKDAADEAQEPDETEQTGSRWWWPFGE